MVNNNQYYKLLAEYLNDTSYENTHNDVYYLRRIVGHFDSNYLTSKIRCKGKYLKEFAKAVGVIVTGTHPNNYYLKNIAELLSETEYNWKSENGYLKTIYEYKDMMSDRISTVLSITTPSNIIYSDEFTMTVKLTDTETNPISNANITLMVGDTIIDPSTTHTTDNNGETTFTYIPMRTGTHTIKAVFSGNLEYSNCTNQVTISVGKETSTFRNVTLSAPVSGSSYYADETILVTGYLIDNDNNPITNAIIDCYHNCGVGTTFTTDDTGYFTGELNDLTGLPTHLTVYFFGGDNYNSTFEQSTISVINPILTITADNPILSYADHDTATLTATITGCGDCTGETVTFYNNTDDTLLGTGTVTLVDGVQKAVCTTAYQSQGIGDVEFEATLEDSSISLIQTFVVHDYYKYWVSVTNNSDTPTIVNMDLPTNYIIKFVVNSSTIITSSNIAYLRFDSESGGYVGKGSSSSRYVGINSTFLPNSVPVFVDTEYTFTKENGVLSLTDGTDTINVTSSEFTKLYSIISSTNGKNKNIRIIKL